MSKIDITPSWLGKPMYPAGIPVTPWQINVEGETLRDLIDRFLVRTLSAEQHIYLKQYIKYCVNAPQYDTAKPVLELREVLKQLLSVDEMLEECFNHGIIPF